MISLITFKEPKSLVSEAYRSIRTNIQFSSIDKKIKTILVTSSKQDEGKSTVISNMAVSFAALEEKKVLIIDADLRNPSVHRKFSLTNTYGLTEILSGQKNFEQVVQNTEINNLQIIAAGKMPPNPSEMLISKKMEDFIKTLEDSYDYIFIDTPPIGVITDAGAIANYSDATVLVVGSGETDIEMAKMTKEKLEKVKANIIGVILNKYMKEDDAYGYYSYCYEQNDGSRKARNKKKTKKLAHF